MIKQFTVFYDTITIKVNPKAKNLLDQIIKKFQVKVKSNSLYLVTYNKNDKIFIRQFSDGTVSIFSYEIFKDNIEGEDKQW